jgi:hypothetical protein
VKIIIIIIIMFSMAGCSTVRTVAGIGPPESDIQAVYPEHKNKVYIVKSNLPDTVKYTVVKDLWYGSGWYGSSDRVIEELAFNARKLGADAVIDVKVWWSPRGMSFASPHASCKAIKLTEPIDLSVYPGEWW